MSKRVSNLLAACKILHISTKIFKEIVKNGNF